MTPFVVESLGVRIAGHLHPATRSDGGAAPTVVLIHGYPDSSALWSLLVPLLTPHARVVTYDVRGAGASEAPASRDGYRFDALMHDLGRVIELVSPDAPVHLVGHDWGAIQGWEAVSRPELARRIASFTAVSAPGFDMTGRWIRARLASPDRRGLADLLVQGRKSWYVGFFQLPRLPERLWHGLAPRWPSVLQRLEGLRPTADWPGPTFARDATQGIELYRANAGRVRSPESGAPRVPCQVLIGSDDPFVSPRLFEDLPREVPIHRIAGARHWLQRSHPRELASAITALVAKVERGPVRPPPARPASARRDRWRDRLVVVTGAGHGIGRATALFAAERGARVIAVDIDRAAAERTALFASHIGPEAHALVADLSRQESVEAMAAAVLDQHGVPDVVVNNAGIGMAGDFLDTSAADWRRIVDLNLWGVLHGCRLFARAMAERGRGGHLVNVASGLAFAPVRGLSAYATTKAAVLMLSEALRLELAYHHIGVSAICPGIVDTGITDRTRYLGADRAEAERRRARANALYRRRALGPEAVAAAIIAAVEEDRAVVPVGAEAHAVHLATRLAPGLLRDLARASALDVLRGRETTTTETTPLHPRKVRHDWSGTSSHWIPGAPYASHTIDALSLLLPAGERWFVRVFKRALPQITDPALRDEVRGFMGQEAAHAVAHQALLDRHLERHGLAPATFTAKVEDLFERVLGEHRLAAPFDRYWLRARVALVASIEVYTAILGQWILDADNLDAAGADPRVLSLLRWHGAEEVEHAHVAFALWRHLYADPDSRGALARALARMELSAYHALLVTPAFIGLILAGSRHLMRHDAVVPRGSARGLRAFTRAARHGHLPHLLRDVIAPGMALLAPAFDPTRHVDRARARAWLAEAAAPPTDSAALAHA